MTVLPPLVEVTDPDYEKYQSGDPAFFVDAAAREVRKYCGWHIAPNRDEVDVRREQNRDGVILLKSLYVTAVSSVIVEGRALRGPLEYDPEFWWEECGLVHRRQASWSYDQGATVSFSHGYETTPTDVKAVVFELATSAAEMPAGNVKSIGTIGFNYTFSDLGITLNRSQFARLASYRLQPF